MNWQQDMAGESPNSELEPELDQALRHFKASVDAWSEAAWNDTNCSRHRTIATTAVRHSWRLAAGWALGCLLAVGTLAGAVHQIVHRQEMARQAAQKAVQKAADERAEAARVIAQPVSVQPEKKLPAATTRKVSAAQDSVGDQDADLLASVDSDVSQQVPAAMEPLAQLMDDGGTQ